MTFTAIPTVRSSVRSLVLALACALAAAPAASAAAPAKKAALKPAAVAACPPVAQPPTNEQIEAAQREARDRGFLWRITKDGRSSYLYGTIHVGRPAWLFPGPQLTAAVVGSDVVALELDVTDPGVMGALQSGMAAKPGSPPLPPKLAQRLRAQLQAECLPDTLMDTLAPEAVATALVSLVGRRDGVDPAYGIDPVYAGMAKGLRKPIESLESPDLQLKLLLSSTVEDQQEGVEKMLRELERGQARSVLLKVARLWAESRFDELADYASWCDCLNTAAERAEFKAMLDDRNPGMADRIDAMHAAGRSVFAAVGSLHMTGPYALPLLMERRGYHVERVDFKH